MLRGMLIAALCLSGYAAPGAEVSWDLSGLSVAKPADKEDAKGTPPPKGAVVLFDGKSLEGWTAKDGRGPAKWKLVEGGVLQAGGGDILSKHMLSGDFKLHVEFRVPYMPKEQGQSRGNSGIYVQGRYEVQVLDSYGLEKPGLGECAAIYGVKPPSVNAAKAPTVWQSYDIEFRSPRFEGGKKVAPAVMTVIWNGVKVQDQTKVDTDNTTAGLGGDPSRPGPLLLQDHGAPVQYRNIWMVPLGDGAPRSASRPPAAGSAAAGESALAEAGWEDLHRLIRPAPDEAGWTKVSWMPATNIWQARQRAAQEGKPLFLWYMAGEPLGVC